MQYIQCSSVHCIALQCSAVQCSAEQCSAVQFSAVQCSSVQCSAVQCSAVQWSAVKCSAVQCSAVQCSAGQCSLVQCNRAYHVIALYADTGEYYYALLSITACQYFYIFKFTTQFHIAALTSTVVIVYCRYQGSTRPRPLTFPWQSCSSLPLALGGNLTPPSVKGPWRWKMRALWTPVGSTYFESFCQMCQIFHQIWIFKWEY